MTPLTEIDENEILRMSAFFESNSFAIPTATGILYRLGIQLTPAFDAVM
jgi:hypothetical protein